MAFIYNEDEKKKQSLPEIVKPGQKNKTATTAKAVVSNANVRKNGGSLDNIASTVFPKQKVSSTPTASKDSWTGKKYSDVTYAEYKAFAQKNGAPQEILDRLEYETTLPGSQFYNPYKGGNSTQAQAAVEAFKKYTGEEVFFDDNFFEHFAYLRNYTVRSDTTGNLTAPNNKFSIEQTCAYWYEQALMDKQTTADVQAQYNEVRNKYAEEYADFKTVYQREPTLEEFRDFVDLSKYSKLDDILNVTYDSSDPQKVSQLNTGTHFNRDTVTGLYYALQNGDDISVDRDYTEDAVKYFLNPVQNAPTVQKYVWSTVDLSTIDEVDYQLYARELARLGEFEELAALEYARWASMPHEDGVVGSNILNETYGFYHDNAWFESVYAAIGDEYNARLTRDGKMSKPGASASVMDKACYELYEEEQKRAKTDEIEAALEMIKDEINGRDPSAYSAEEFNIYLRDVRSAVKGLDCYDLIEKYLKDPTDTCRNIPISEDTIDSMIGRHWKDLSINEKIDYGVVLEDGYENHFDDNDPPMTPPEYYDEQEEWKAMNDLVDRKSTKMTLAEAVFAFSESGANIGSSDIAAQKIIPETYSKSAGASEILANIWYSIKQSQYLEKLGDGYTYDQAMAIDPILKSVSAAGGVTTTRELTVSDIAQIGHLSSASDIGDEEMTLTTGLVARALPGLEYLTDHIDYMYEKYGLESAYNAIKASVFDVASYADSYRTAIWSGMNEKDAAKKAYNEAVTVAAANKSIQNAYEGDSEIVAAANELTHQMHLEEGMDEVAEIVSNINDDVLSSGKTKLGEHGEPVDMTELNAAILVGSSSLADPAFAAQTKDITHDFITGEITPDDIREAVMAHTAMKDAENLKPPVAASKPEEPVFVPDGERTVVTPSGLELSASDYTAMYEEEQQLMYGLKDYTEMSDNLKREIGYDTIMNQVSALQASGMAVNADELLQVAVSNAHMTNGGQYFPTELMHGATDVDKQISAYASARSEDQIAQNIADNERNLIQEIIENGNLNFLPQLAAFAGYLTTDTYHVVERLQNNSKYFSAGELSSMLKAFGEGKITAPEIDAMVDSRAETFPVEYINALGHPAALEESYAEIDRYLASNPENDIYNKVAELYKQLGEYGFYADGLTNEDIKIITGGEVDLDAAGTTMREVMDMIGGENWRYPYSNDGSGDFMYTVFGGISDGIGNVLAFPSKAVYYLKRVFGNDTKSNGLKTFDEVDANEAEFRRNVQSASEAFVQQGISEMTRILLTSSFGAGASSLAAKTLGAASVGMKARQFATIAGRIPFASSVFVNDVYDYLAKDEPVIKSTIKSALHASIELATGAMPLEKLLSFKVGNAGVLTRALRTIDNSTPLAVSWITQTAKNVCTEIGEEEISMILNRIVDFGDYVISGENVNEASANALEGFGADFLATAQATAFTTLLLGMYDLGGLTYQGMRMSMELGTEYNAENMARDIAVDIATLAKNETVAESEEVETESVQHVEASTAEASGEETAPVEEGDTKPSESAYDPASQVPVFKSNKESKTSNAEQKYIDAAAKAMLTGNAADVDAAAYAAEEYEAELASQNATDIASEETEASTEEIAMTFEDPSTQPAFEPAPASGTQSKESVKQIEKTSTEAPASSDEVTPAQPELSTSGANRVLNFINQANETGIPSAIANAGAKAKVKAVVDSDPRVESARKAAQLKQDKIAEVEQEISRRESESRQVEAKRERAIRAAVDEGAEINGSAMTNTLAQLNQQLSGIVGKISDLTEKLSPLYKESVSLAEEVDKVTAEVESEVWSSLYGDIVSRMKQFKLDTDRSAEQFSNARRDENGELVVEALETDEEYRASKARNQVANAKMSDRYASGEINLDEYTDPANYPVSTERYRPDWQERQKETEDIRNEEEQKHIRLTQDFMASDSSKGQMVEVSSEVYDTISANMQTDLGYVDGSHIQTRGTYQSEFEKNNNVLEFNKDGKVIIKDDAFKSALDVLSDDNGSSEEHIVGAEKKTVIDSKWDHVTENDKYLVIKKHNETKESDLSDKDALRNYSQKDSEGRDGAERLKARHDSAKADMEKARNAHIKAAQTKAEAEARFDADRTDEQAAAAYRKSVFEEQRTARFLRQMSDIYNKALDNLEKISERVRTARESSSQKNSSSAYYAIDKEALSEYSFDAINSAAQEATANEMGYYQDASKEELVELCVSQKIGKSDPESDAVQSVRNILSTVYAEMSPDDLKIELRSMIYKEKCEMYVRGALSKAFTPIKSKSALNAFISANGGESTGAKDSGVGFATFTQRKRGSTKYVVSEFALRKYGKTSDVEAHDVSKSKSVEDFDNELAFNINAYARENNLTDEQRTSLIESLSLKSTSNGTPFYAVASDGNYTLMARKKDQNDTSANSWIRDNNATSKTFGEYSAVLAWQRIKKKMDDMVSGEEKYGNINPDRNSIQITWVDEKGKKHTRKFGEFYGEGEEDTNERGYWMPSLKWIQENALSVVCNFHCYNPGKNATPEQRAASESSRLNIKLVANQHVSSEDSYDPNSVFEEDAYMRTRSDLASEYKQAQKDFNFHEDNPYFKRVYFEAKLNGIINRMRQIASSFEAKGVTADKRQYLVDEYKRLEESHQAVLAELFGNEEGYSRLGASQHVKKGGGQTDYVAIAPSEARKLLEESIALYDRLASGDPRYELPEYQAQKKTVASMIEYYRAVLDRNPATKASEPKATNSIPKYTDAEVEHVLSRVSNATYDTEESFYDDLSELKALEVKGADVSAERSDLVSRYHRFKTKDMTSEEKMSYTAEIAEYAKTHPNSYIIDPNADYEKMLGDTIESAAYGGAATDDEKKLRRQFNRIKNNAGSYKTISGINNALKRLDGMEKAGIDVSEVRNALEENMKRFEKNDEQKIVDSVIETADPVVGVNLQLLGGYDEYGFPEYEDYLDHTETDRLAETAEPSWEIRPYKPHAPYNYTERAPGKTPVVIKNPYTADIDPVSGVGHAEIDRKSYYGKDLLAGVHSKDSINIISKDDNAAVSADSVISEERELFETRQSIKGIQNRINEIDKLITEAAENEDVTALQEEKMELIGKRTEAKAYRDKLHKNLNTNALKSAALEDVSSPNVSVFKSEYRLANATRAVENVTNIMDLDEDNFTTFTDSQANEIIGSAFSETELANNKAIGGSIAKDAKNYDLQAKRLRMRIECADAVLGGSYTEGINMAIPGDTTFRNVLDTYYQAVLQEKISIGETTIDEENENRSVYSEVFGEVSEWLDEFNTFPEFDMNGIKARILDMHNQAEELESMARNAEISAKAMYSMSAESLSDLLNTRTGGRMPVQIMDMFSVLMSRTPKKITGKKAIMDFGGRNFLNPYQVVQSYTGKASALVNKYFIEPVIRNNADAQRKLDEYLNRIKETKINYKNSADFHKWAEGYLAKGKIPDDMWEELGYITYEQYNDLHNGEYESENEMIADLRVFREIYEESHELANESLAANGLDTIGYIEDYLPHTLDKGNGFDEFMSSIFDAELPSVIAGRTEEFNPLHQWNPHAMHRSGNKTKFDMLKNFESYINPTLNAIYHTGDIVRIRQLTAALEGMDKKSEETGHVEGNLQTFAKWTRAYANQLAGKKTVFDHAIESASTRGLYALANTLKRVRSDSLISGNLKVATSNLLPLVQIAALDHENTAKAITAVVSNEFLSSGGISLSDVMSRSSFLASRNGEKKLPTSAYRAIVDKGYIPMEAIDNAVSKIVWATCYLNSAERNGATVESSIIRADRMALEIMSSKVKGEGGIAYNSPVSGAIFQFTSEGINLVNYMMSTMPKYCGGSPAKILKNILISVIGYWMYNELFASSSAPDIVGTVYHGVKNEKSMWNVLKDVFGEINPADRFTDGGISGVPAISGFVDLAKSINGLATKGFTEESAGDVFNAILGFVPGGAQINRTAQGAASLIRGYNRYGGKIKHPVEPNAYNIPAALIFGPQATIEGRASSWGNTTPVSGTAEEQMIALHDHGISWTDAYNTVTKSKVASDEKSQVTAGTKIGADTSAHEEEWQKNRNEVVMPPEMSKLPPEFVQKESVQKGIEIWKKSGVDVYPKGLSYSSTTYEGVKHVGISVNNVIHELTEEEMADLDKWYLREYDMILSRYDEKNETPEDLKKALDDMQKRIKKDYIAERGD